MYDLFEIKVYSFTSKLAVRKTSWLDPSLQFLAIFILINSLINYQRFSVSDDNKKNAKIMIKVNNIVTTMTKLNDILTIFMYSLNKSIKEKDFVEYQTR